MNATMGTGLPQKLSQMTWITRHQMMPVIFVQNTQQQQIPYLHGMVYSSLKKKMFH